MVLTILLMALALLAAAFILVLARAALRREAGAPKPEAVLLGAVANQQCGRAKQYQPRQ